MSHNVEIRLSAAEIEKALSGEYPERDKRMSNGELGRRLAAHRTGAYQGYAYTRQYISNILNGRQPIAKDFEDAFLSWRAAEIQRLAGFRAINVDGMSVDELLQEAGRIQVVGDGEPDRLILIARGFHGLIGVNGAIEQVHYNGSLRKCAWKGCKRRFIPRSWNHRVCSRTYHLRQEREQKRPRP